VTTTSKPTRKASFNKYYSEEEKSPSQKHLIPKIVCSEGPIDLNIDLDTLENTTTSNSEDTKNTSQKKLSPVSTTTKQPNSKKVEPVDLNSTLNVIDEMSSHFDLGLSIDNISPKEVSKTEKREGKESTTTKITATDNTHSNNATKKPGKTINLIADDQENLDIEEDLDKLQEGDERDYYLNSSQDRYESDFVDDSPSEPKKKTKHVRNISDSSSQDREYQDEDEYLEQQALKQLKQLVISDTPPIKKVKTPKAIKNRRDRMITSDNEEENKPVIDLSKETTVNLNQQEELKKNETKQEEITAEKEPEQEPEFSLDLNIELEDLDLNMDLENLDTADLEKAYEPPPDNIKSPSYNIVQYVMASTKSPFKENYNDDNDVLNITISPSTMQNRENMLKRLKKKRESFHAVASPKQKENIKIRMIAINSDSEEAESNPQKPKLPDFPPSKQIDLDSDQEEKENNPAPSLKPKCINSSASSSVTPKKPKQRKSPIKQKILDSSYSSESPSPKKSVRNPQTKKSIYKSSKKAISSSENSPTPVKPSKNSKKQNTKNTKNLRSTKPQKKSTKKYESESSSASESSPEPKYSKVKNSKSKRYDESESEDSSSSYEKDSSSSAHSEDSYSSSESPKKKVNVKGSKKNELQTGELINNLLTKVPSSGPLQTYNFPNEEDPYPDFVRNKYNYARELFKFVNQIVFDQKLPLDLKIEWSGRLRSTAGITRLMLSGSDYLAKIDLSSVIINHPERLCRTLIHELCHAAVWIIHHNRNDHHGPIWQNWMRRAKARFPQLQGG